MRTLLELLRIIVIFALLGALGWTILGKIYAVNGIADPYSWIGALALLVLLFVLYRNKLQFSGWDRSKNKKRLPTKVSLALIIISIILMIAPLLLGTLLS